ncbi:UNVERIFIED_CONTAM: hypothetical protein Sradi_3298800 [Sesamum radiatum]|uniref:Uncharacterized protein n=1 Tax=Sesamum radiatum TaxID=300843 RepID=A0AAW2R1P2_SESRA
MDTLLYGFVGEVVHPLGQILFPLSLGVEPARKTKMVHFLVVDMPSTYNVILGRPALNSFQAAVTTYHMKLKFPARARIGEVIGDQYVPENAMSSQ